MADATRDAPKTTLEITAENGPQKGSIGARVYGIDGISNCDVLREATIQQAFLAHHVLVFPANATSTGAALMDPLEVRSFASCFGEPIAEVNRSKRDGELPEVSHLDSTIRTREQDGNLKFHFQPAIRSEDWHTDQSFQEVPAMATILHAHEVPSRGGATWFCNTAAAYDALPDAMKSRLHGLRAAHSYDTPRARYRPAPRTQAEIDDTPDVIHPLVRTHPQSGRKALYLNFNRLDHIVGMARAASDKLLDELATWVTQDRFIYRHSWAVGDTVVWDNRCTLHRVSYDSPAGERRVMLRVVTRGDRPF